MNISLLFVRLFFTLISVIIATVYAIHASTDGFIMTNVLFGIGLGIGGSLMIMGIEGSLRHMNLRIFNTIALGLFFGFLMGQGITLILDTVIDLNVLLLRAETTALIKTTICVVALYFGLVLTMRSSEKIYVNIPFVKIKPDSQRRKDIILDSSVLTDTRILDLASSGLLDNSLILPQFLLKELYQALDNADEHVKTKAKRCLEVIKKLEEIPHLEMRYADNDFPEVKDTLSKLLRLARLLDANVFTADPSKVQQSSYEGVRFISIHFLSNALKPITNAGEQITIKIQRYGKEPRQGVGYLEDGTMVVVNGGADSLGETIRAQVLSVKHTSSGRMIFCNAADGLMGDDYSGCGGSGFDLPSVVVDTAAAASMKNYFAVKN